MKTPQVKLKRIAAITMVRNDDFFLHRWLKYYGDQFGPENLYIYLDGTDQPVPQNAGAAHIEKLPHTDLSRAAGDKYRIGKLNELARELLETYDIVIGCDCDEFLIVGDGPLNNDLQNLINSYSEKFPFIRFITYPENKGL